MGAASFVDDTVSTIDSRLGEINEERSRLEAARSALLGRNGHTTATAPARARARAMPRAAAKARGRRSGGRADQALALVRATPGITIPQLAVEMKIEPNYLYRVMPKLAREGLVVRQGDGWAPVSSD